MKSKTVGLALFARGKLPLPTAKELEGLLKEKGLSTRGTKAQLIARLPGELCNKMRMSDNINSIAGYIYMPARQVVAQASSPYAQYTQSPPSAYAEASGSG